MVCILPEVESSSFVQKRRKRGNLFSMKKILKTGRRKQLHAKWLNAMLCESICPNPYYCMFLMLWLLYFVLIPLMFVFNSSFNFLWAPHMFAFNGIGFLCLTAVSFRIFRFFETCWWLHKVWQIWSHHYFICPRNWWGMINILTNSWVFKNLPAKNDHRNLQQPLWAYACAHPGF